MATTSQTSTAPAFAKVSRTIPRALAIAALAILATAAGIAATTLAFSVTSGSGDVGTVTVPGLVPGSRDDYFRDQRPAVTGHVGDKHFQDMRSAGASQYAPHMKDAWYLEKRVPAVETSAPAERIRDRWYRE